MTDGIHILGIRHHGPGSARSVATALEAIQPDVILLEGPPDAQELLSIAAAAEMQPPVAILIYRPDEPRRAVYYPFASFSPEWQAIQYGLKRGVQVKFMDLPQRHRLAYGDEDHVEEIETVEQQRLREDPMKFVAQAAGYSDSERWWEEQFEKRREGPDVFKAVLELMTALREETQTPLEPMEARREAWMRQTLREAMKEGFSRIAVVLGAWHGPALAKMPTAKSDAEILKGMPKVTVAATWMPWTHRRLTFASGYGAGVHSPGYYEHLWTVHNPDQVAVRWMTRVAHLLRNEDLESSTASVIEATRLAETTAALRARTLPGLAEFNEAAQAVFCFGDSAAMRLISERLIVGDRLGTVPDEAQQVPLQRDLQKEQRRLRLAPEALDKTVELDLRKPNDLDRSRLLHRLRLLKVPWGKAERSRGTGTFREAWRLRWEPELEVALLEAAPWGNTVEQAATQFAVHLSQNCSALPELTALVETLLLAELPDAVEAVMHQLENQAALTTDVNHLMDALPPLVNVMRYGNVRQTDTAMVEHVVNGLVARICIGLPPACSSLNEDAAKEMLDRINATHSAITTLSEDTLRTPWTETLRRLADTESLNGLLAGRCCRILFEDHVHSMEETATRLSRSLSRGNTPSAAAAWLEGFLSGSGLVLLHQPELWSLIDAWITTLSPDHFTDVLPLLRRTFSTFELGERRQMGELARRGGPSVRTATPVEDDIDENRARRVLPTIAALLGSNALEPQRV
ncbi:DUF5682 family protein [Verrucomicrobiota bacterium sgz303538]